MEIFSALLALCEENQLVYGGFSSQRLVMRSFDVFFDLRLNNGWANNRDAGDLRRIALMTSLWWVKLISQLTHWGRVTHICVSKLTIIGSDNGLSPGRRQAIIWTNAGILLIWTLGTNFSEILSKIHIFSFKKIHFKMSSGKRRPFCLGLNEVRMSQTTITKVLCQWKRPNFARNSTEYPSVEPYRWLVGICVNNGSASDGQLAVI